MGALTDFLDKANAVADKTKGYVATGTSLVETVNQAGQSIDQFNRQTGLFPSGSSGGGGSTPAPVVSVPTNTYVPPVSTTPQPYTPPVFTNPTPTTQVPAATGLSTNMIIGLVAGGFFMVVMVVVVIIATKK